MYCSQCGATVSDNASFCHKCGKPIAPVPSESASAPAQTSVESIPPNTAEAVDRLMSATVPPIKPSAPTRRQITISIVLAIILVGMYWQAFETARWLGKVYKGSEIGSFLLVNGFIFWYFWKCLNRRGWVGAIVGVIVAFLVLVLSSTVATRTKINEQTDILDQVPQLSALKRNFPEIANQVREEWRGLSDTPENRQKLMAMLQAKVAPIVPAALKTTSDAAVLEYANAKIRQLEDVAAANAGDCVLLITGKLSGAPPATVARVMGIVTPDTAKAVQSAIIKVLNEADTFRNSPPASDEKRFTALSERLDRKLKSAYGTSAYYYSDDSSNVSLDVRCKSGVLMFKEALNLPEKDRSFVLRILFAGD